MSKISFARPNWASLQGESPFFMYITGARRFSWHLRQRQQPPFFIPEELQSKAVPEVWLIWLREGEEQMLTLQLWDFHQYNQPYIEDEAPVSKRAEMLPLFQTMRDKTDKEPAGISSYYAEGETENENFMPLRRRWHISPEWATTLTSRVLQAFQRDENHVMKEGSLN